MANDFFLEIASQAACLNITLHMEIKESMSNALFLIYSSMVSGVETPREVYQGRPSAQGQWSQQRPWDRRRGCPWPLRASSGTVSVVSSPGDCLSCAPLWNPVPPEDRAPFTCLKDADLCGTGPRGLLTDDTLLSFPVESFAGNTRAWLRVASLCRLGLVGLFVSPKKSSLVPCVAVGARMREPPLTCNGSWREPGSCVSDPVQED